MLTRRIMDECRDNRKMARGVTSVTGSEIDFDTGLAQVEDAVVSIKQSAAPGLDVSLATWAPGTEGGQINLYCWKPTAVADCTLIAATAAVDVEWIAIGS